MRDVVADFKVLVAHMANENAKILTGRYLEVQAIIDRHEIVFAVWQDFNEPQGVGILLVKGKNDIREIAVSDAASLKMMTAIPCIEYEQAEALRLHIGERDSRH